MPTPERDLEDQADLEGGRKSLVQIVAERNGTTADQAKEPLERVLEDNQWYADLLKSKGLTTPDPIVEPPKNPRDPAAPDDAEDDPDKPLEDDEES